MRMCIDDLWNIACARLGDGQVEEVQIDISDWRRRYPQLEDYHVTVRSPGGIVYLPAVTMGDDLLIWTITKADTATAGRGSYAVLATGPNEAQKITPAYIFEVKASMASFQTEEPPDPARPWVANVLEAAKKAEAAAERAEAAAKRAENAGGGSAEGLEDIVRRLEKIEEEAFRATGRTDYGALFYTDQSGNLAPLALGEGLAIVDGVLTLTGVTPPVEPEEIVAELDDTGDMTVAGYAAVIDETGNMTITGLAAELDDAGNMTFAKE